MGDRIVPATTDQDRRRISEVLGFDDAWPVVTESFRQWVIEDRFTTGRPGRAADGTGKAGQIQGAGVCQRAVEIKEQGFDTERPDMERSFCGHDLCLTIHPSSCRGRRGRSRPFQDTPARDRAWRLLHSRRWC